MEVAISDLMAQINVGDGVRSLNGKSGVLKMVEVPDPRNGTPGKAIIVNPTGNGYVIAP